MVGGDGEGLQHFEVDLAGAVGVEQVRRDIAEAQALLDQALGGAEACRDGGDGEAGIGQLREGDDLVDGMHGDADDVLRQGQLARHIRIGGDQAGHRVVGVDNALLGQCLSNVRAYGTVRGVFIREDFWFIAVTEGNEDETEIHACQRPCREDGP